MPKPSKRIKRATVADLRVWLSQYPDDAQIVLSTTTAAQAPLMGAIALQINAVTGKTFSVLLYD